MRCCAQASVLAAGRARTYLKEDARSELMLDTGDDCLPEQAGRLPELLEESAQHIVDRATQTSLTMQIQIFALTHSLTRTFFAQKARTVLVASCRHLFGSK